MTEYKPVGDRVVIDPEPRDEGLIIQTEKHRPDRGTVIAVGPGLPKHPTEVVPGDKVYFRWAAALKFEKGLVVVHESEIFGTYE